jgi:serine protease Do
MAGELIGIVNAKQLSAGIEGLGFAIPSNVVLSDINDILELGYISGRVTLGVEVIYGQPNGQAGVYVSKTSNPTLKYADRIVKINDTAISSISDYNAMLKRLSVGQEVNIQLVRSGKFVNVTVIAQENTSAH